MRFITDAGYPPPLRFTKAAGSVFVRRWRVSIPHRHSQELKLPASVDGVARANQASLLELCSWLNEWFEDAPMLLQFEHGELAVITSSGCKTAVLWNEIVHKEKPVWFDVAPEEFEWEEDLVWKEYFDLNEAIVKRIEIIDAENSVIGIVITTDLKEFGIVDGGDITIALEEEELWRYLDEERTYGFALSSVLDNIPNGKHFGYDHFARIFNRNIRIGVYPYVDFIYGEQRYRISADLKNVFLFSIHEWDTRIVLNVNENDLEYDERPETLIELREAYQNYLDRLSD